MKAEYAKLEQRAPEWKRQWNQWKDSLDQQHEAHKAWKRQRKASSAPSGVTYSTTSWAPSR